MSGYRSPLVDAVEDEAMKVVAEQLAMLGADPLDEREAVLVTMGIRAGIGAAFTAEGEHG